LRSPYHVQVFCRTYTKYSPTVGNKSCETGVATADYFFSALKLSKEKLLIREELYLPSLMGILNAIQTFDEPTNHIGIVSHNFGISDFVTKINNNTNTFYEVPTCGIVKIVFNVDTWMACSVENAILENYWFPA
jgi:phosphohistidine phosphatase SixA